VERREGKGGGRGNMKDYFPVPNILPSPSSQILNNLIEGAVYEK